MSRLPWNAGVGMAFLLSLAATSHGQPAAPEGPIGFAPSSREAQARGEAVALAVPTPERARAWLHALTEEPHVAGTPADRKTALFVRDKLRQWGWEADLAEYEVLLNYPRTGMTLLEIVRPNPLGLEVTEDPVRGDKDSASPDAFPAFHGYGVSGDVTGQVVYANYGRAEDFETLDRRGISVEGKVVLARYGEVFRGLKVRNAQKRGAKGILIYSDPADDGYAKGDVYPEGPYRPGSAIQRGSVQFLPFGPGDPSTPKGPSVKGAARLPIDPYHGLTLGRAYPHAQGLGSGFPGEATPMEVAEWERQTGLVRNEVFAAIPSLPISYDAARPILEALGGPNVPSGWQGGLPLAYHVGPGPVEVHFRTVMDYQVRPIWNVIAKLRGTVEPDHWVMIGNHRDAWVYGAVDPGSGTAATLETCRALGEAVKAGWKPKRTVIYASWDAEEYGLVGSTEWADEHAAELDRNAVMMLNVDSAVAGPNLDAQGVPSLRDLFLDASGAITDPRTGRPLRRAWVEKNRASWAGNATIELADPSNTSPSTAGARPQDPFSPRLGPLGSGSDYTAFVDHLGIPAMDVDFGGRYGVYHSVYDDFRWMERHGDPEFLTHATAARLYALIAMRAAGADVLPMTFVPYAEAIRSYLDALRRDVERKRLAATPGEGKPPIAFEGLPRLLEALRAFEAEATSLDRATKALAARDGVPAARLARVNDALVRVERAFLLPGGLPGRPWFKHAIYAPGLTTGYAAWPLPGPSQAIREGDAAMLAAQAEALASRLDAAAEALRAARGAAEGDDGPPAAGAR